MKNIKYILLVAVVIAFVVVTLLKPSSASGWIPNLLREKAEIKLPLGTQSLEETDDKATRVAVCAYLLPEKALAEFAEKYAWQPLPDSGRILTQGNALSPNYQPNLTSRPDFRLITGCKSGYAWKLLLNTRSGELWVEVVYPDLAGNGVECGD